MNDNFNDFLQGEIFAPGPDDRLEITEAVEEEESRKYATGGVELNSSFECHSTHRIPTLFQYALFSITKVINTLTASKEQADQLPTLFANLKQLPEHAKKGILPQLTFTALKKYYGDDIWDMLAHPTKDTLPTLLSCMKQEEDMLRYLYEYAPENEYLLENQDKILLNVFEEVPAKCLVTTKLECAPDTIICGFDYSKQNNKNLDSSDDEYYMEDDSYRALGPVVDHETFKKNWSTFTCGLLDELDWSNCFAAGGSVLACLRNLPGGNSTSDIDLYLVGLEKKGAQEKLQHIWDVLQRKIGDRKLHVLKTKNTFTFFADLPFRPIQVITGLYKSPTEVLCSFDLDCITVGYNGSQVLALPRFVLSMSTALNFLDSDMNLSNKLQYTRLSKYDERGFSTCLPYTLRNHALGGFDCDLPEDPRVEELPSNVHKLVELMSLAKVVLLSRTLYNFNFERLVSKITAWNLRWQKGISIGRMRWSLLENDALKRAGENSLSKEYAKLRDLALLTVDQLRQFWAEAPRYESVSIELSNHQWGNAQYYLNKFKPKLPVASSVEEFKPILNETEFSTYASSMLQCFYLDIIVPCENSGKALTHNLALESSSPLSYINTSLSRLDYEFFSVDVKFTGLDALWQNKTFEIISEPVKAGKHSWRVKLDSKKRSTRCLGQFDTRRK